MLLNDEMVREYMLDTVKETARKYFDIGRDVVNYFEDETKDELSFNNNDLENILDILKDIDEEVSELHIIKTIDLYLKQSTKWHELYHKEKSNDKYIKRIFKRRYDKLLNERKDNINIMMILSENDIERITSSVYRRELAKRKYGSIE